MTITALDLLRFVTIFISSIVFGLCIVVLYYYLHHHDKQLIQVDPPHILLLAISYVGAIVMGIANVLQDAINHAPFMWYSSPLLLLSTCVAGYGMLRLLQYEKGRLKDRR